MRKIVYSTCPLWQAGVDNLEELKTLEKQRLEKARAEAFNSACRAVINAKPLYPHPGYKNISKHD